MRTDGEEKEMRLMGTGARSKVYSDGRFAWKVYGKGVEKSAVFYEALVHSLAERAGVPTAKIYGVYETKGVFSVKKMCIRDSPVSFKRGNCPEAKDERECDILRAKIVHKILPQLVHRPGEKSAENRLGPSKG